MRFAYHPIPFYLITVGAALLLSPLAAYFSARDEPQRIQPYLMLHLLLPALCALAFIFFSGNREMIHDFTRRFVLFRIGSGYLACILFLMPALILLATAISLLFGGSVDQFRISEHLTAVKGWGLLGMLLPLVLAPLIEELGWRGYGVDSLRAYNNLFVTSLTFGALWALWHLPLVFVKGYYQNELVQLGPLYVFNFFASVFVVAFVMNWIFYSTGRSIPALILFHAVLNLSMMLFRTEPRTKCIATLLLCVVVLFVVMQNRPLFFGVRYAVRSLLEKMRIEYGFPGATAAYVLGDGESGSVAVGFADVEKNRAMQPESRMLAASIGKTFVSATLLALAKEGRLDLDDPLSSYLGDRTWYSRLPNGDSITLRQLANHTSGLPDHVYQEGFERFFRPEGAEPEELIETILGKPPLFAPGEGWHYTDTGYLLLGLVIEDVTGESYYDEVDRRFIEPLGLTSTSPSNRRDLAGLAAGYAAGGKTVDDLGVMVWNPGLEWTGGGLVTTSADLARWAKLLYEGRAMEGDYLRELLTGVEMERGRFGLGVLITNESQGHGGVIPGYTSSMRYYPKEEVAIAFQINSDFEKAEEVEKRLKRVVLSEANAFQ